MKRNMIEKYYVEDGQPKVVMNQNAAMEIKVAIDAFRAGIKKSNFTTSSQERLTGEYVVDTFLRDNKSKFAAKAFPGVWSFLYTVEKKIKELLEKE